MSKLHVRSGAEIHRYVNRRPHLRLWGWLAAKYNQVRYGRTWR